jgi:hypothetical protein
MLKPEFYCNAHRPFAKKGQEICCRLPGFDGTIRAPLITTRCIGRGDTRRGKARGSLSNTGGREPHGYLLRKRGHAPSVRCLRLLAREHHHDPASLRTSTNLKGKRNRSWLSRIQRSCLSPNLSAADLTSAKKNSLSRYTSRSGHPARRPQ